MADADKTSPNPAERRIETRDPNGPHGVITVDPATADQKLPRTTYGSTHLTANIDGKYYVVNAFGEKLLKTAYDTEQEAIDKAQEYNHKGEAE